MGNGIAQVSAVAGCDVVMVDVSDAAVERGLAMVASSLDRLVKKEKLTAADRAAALGRIRGTTQYRELEPMDLVIEAATENLDIKRRIMTQADQIMRHDAVLATNTSSISITASPPPRRAARALHRHAFLQSRSAHGAGGADPRAAHERRDPATRRRVHPSASARPPST